MTLHEKNKRRAAIVRRHRVWLREHGLEDPPVRKTKSDPDTERAGFDDPLDILPDLG